jgi:hypothetical protein
LVASLAMRSKNKQEKAPRHLHLAGHQGET